MWRDGSGQTQNHCMVCSPGRSGRQLDNMSKRMFEYMRQGGRENERTAASKAEVYV